MKSPDASAFDRCEAVGAWTAPFLAEHPEAETRVDAALQAELGRLAVAKAREWTDRQAAAALLHLAIDAFIYLEQGKPNLGVSTGETVAETPAPSDAPAAKPVPAPAPAASAPLDGHSVVSPGARGYPSGMGVSTASTSLSREGVLEALAGDRAALRGFGVRRLALFGSAARDESSPESDVDVLVTFERKTFRAYVGLLRHLENLLGRKVDLVIEEAIKPAIRGRILAEKIDVPLD